MDVTLEFAFVKSDTHPGYNLVLRAGEESQPIGPVLTFSSGIAALIRTITQPAIAEERMTTLEEASAVTQELMDRVTEAEAELVAVKETLEQTRTALINMIAGGAPRQPTTPQRLVPGPAAVQSSPRSTAVPPEIPGYSIPGFAGTFKRPLEETVHAGPGEFEGGPFRRSPKHAELDAGLDAGLAGGDDPENPGTLGGITGGVVKRG